MLSTGDYKRAVRGDGGRRVSGAMGGVFSVGPGLDAAAIPRITPLKVDVAQIQVRGVLCICICVREMMGRVSYLSEGSV